jgi:Stress responsive A/B Barrel Domain
LIGELNNTNNHVRGRDVSVENLHQGFTHVFGSTFDSTHGIAEYIVHHAHVQFADIFLPALDKVLVVDFHPTAVAVAVAIADN